MKSPLRGSCHVKSHHCAHGHRRRVPVGPGVGAGRKKFLDKTQAEWLKILEEHKEKRFRRAAVLVLKVEFPKTQDTMTALARALANDAAPEVRQEIASALGDFRQGRSGHGRRPGPAAGAGRKRQGARGGRPFAGPPGRVREPPRARDWARHSRTPIPARARPRRKH